MSAGVTGVEAGEYHSCALTNGAALCWGYNGFGQLGDGTTTDSTFPVQVRGLTAGVTAITAGRHHTCAIVDGAAYCWGDNGLGQLGNATTQGSATPVAVDGL